MFNQKQCKHLVFLSKIYLNLNLNNKLSLYLSFRERKRTGAACLKFIQKDTIEKN